MPKRNDISQKRFQEENDESENKTNQRNSPLISILNQDTETLETRTEEINQILQRNNIIKGI